MHYAAGIAIVLSMFISGVLLAATGWLWGRMPVPWRCILAIIASGLYATACLIPEWRFLGEVYWRIFILVLVALTAFGWHRIICIYILLTLAMDGIVIGIGQGFGWKLIPAVLTLLAIYLVVFRGNLRQGEYVPVELALGEKHIKITALRDTGNTLRDPISGLPVLILDVRASGELTGLSRNQLCLPVETMRESPIIGLRLIPYKTIATSGGLILGLHLTRVRVGNWQGSLTVAFAPEEFSSSGEYQALAGGTM